jgi:hypothetical protein
LPWMVATRRARWWRMADNVIILDADGNRITVGADDVTSRNGSTVPAEKIQREKVGFGGDGTYQDVSAATPMPVTDAAQATVHTDLAALLTELGQKLEPADLNLLATAAKQDVAHTDLAAILAKLSADPATQTTLAAILTKLTTSAGAPLAIRVSDGTAYLTLATVSDRLKVDVGGSLPAGSNLIGGVTLPNVTSSAPLPVTDATAPFAGTMGTSTASVTTSSTTAVAARAGRALLELTNPSDTPIWFAVDTSVGGTPAAAVNSGYWLGPNGGFWSQPYGGAVRALHAATGTKSMLVAEW